MNSTFFAKAIAVCTLLFVVSACTATEDTLTLGEQTQTPSPIPVTPPPDAVVSGAPVQPAPETATTAPAAPAQSAPAPVATAAPTTQTTQVEPATGQPQVYFAPIVGAPVDKVTALSQRLSARSAQQGIQLIAARGPTTTHEIRGYFSAISTSNGTIVTHVWDVFTPAGVRVHRIQGQETVSGNASDTWSVVPATTMQTIADKVLSNYNAWRSTQS
ncbi:MAG: hypothetical protein AAFY99_09525 [Pseudomonadota bacterium]